MSEPDFTKALVRFMAYLDRQERVLNLLYFSQVGLLVSMVLLAAWVGWQLVELDSRMQAVEHIVGVDGSW